MTTYHVEARATGRYPATAIVVLYGRDWEVCEGSHGLTHEECMECIREWTRDDRRTVREIHGIGARSPMVHEYRAMPD